MKLNWQDWSETVWSINKKKLDKVVNDHTSAIYVENESELSRPIWDGAIYDVEQKGQWRDRSYRCGLCQQ